MLLSTCIWVDPSRLFRGTPLSLGKMAPPRVTCIWADPSRVFRGTPLSLGKMAPPRVLIDSLIRDSSSGGDVCSDSLSDDDVDLNLGYHS
ncbi:hypothetical protein L1987_70528 [Smallanthus sonchifolius]|uniref:Uncharacterized protein n=1 Tax=Smallanthus sonchifolius TaxID=185202 RepID=A0ACB9APJ7_9ASTR|nr:hypothetical protein L1987_70528 [Smallanthus sonchifolius]